MSGHLDALQKGQAGSLSGAIYRLFGHSLCKALHLLVDNVIGLPDERLDSFGLPHLAQKDRSPVKNHVYVRADIHEIISAVNDQPVYFASIKVRAAS